MTRDSLIAITCATARAIFNRQRLVCTAAALAFIAFATATHVATEYLGAPMWPWPHLKADQ